MRFPVIEVWDHVYVREDGDLREHDCHVIDEGRIALRRGMSPETYAQVRDYLFAEHEIEVCPVLPLATT
jgi:hypothetical protein